MSTSTNPDVHNEFEPAKEADRRLLEELEKDIDEMDVSVIEAAIQDFYPKDPDTECARMLRRIKREARAERARPVRRRIAGIAAAAACLLLLGGGTISAAHAFQIDSLLQFFSAFGELFSYESRNAGDAFSLKKETDGAVMEEGAWLDEEENKEISFDSAGAFLQAIDMYPDGFARLLARYPFNAATLNDDGAFASYLLTLGGMKDGMVYVRCIRQHAKDSSISYFYENDEEQVTETWIDGVKVAVAPNYEVNAVRWSQDDVHVDIWGKAPEDQLLEIAEIMIGVSS